jgi:hypothetical protein
VSESVNRTLKRYRDAKRRKLNWDRRYQDALDYAAPERETYSMESEDRKQSDKVFDGIAGIALDAFVSNIQSTLFPPVKTWINLRAGSAVAEKSREESNQYLSTVTDIMFEALRNSNFDTQISSSFYDYALGVGALLVQKGTKEKPFHFTSVHVGQIYLEEGPLGRIDASYRESKIPIRNIIPTWPDATLPQSLEGAMETRPDEKVCVVEAIVPRKIKTPVSGETAFQEVDGYCYYVILELGEEKSLLLEREQESSPWVIFRWPGLPEQLYPQGPLLKALPDIKSYNKAKELVLKRASRDLYGIYTCTDEGVVNIDNIQFGSMCFIPVESNGGPRGASLAPLPPAGDMGPLTQFIFNDLELKINKAMFAEPLGRVDLPVKTATEIALRQQELAKKIGAAFGRLQYELMQPLINRLLYILEELGLIDLNGFKVDGRVVNIEYMSPLALAQDQEDFMTAVSYVETMGKLYGTQVMMAMAPPDRFAKFFAGKLHVPIELLPTEQELNTMKQALIQQAAQNEIANQAAVAPQAALEEVA